MKPTSWSKVVKPDPASGPAVEPYDLREVSGSVAERRVPPERIGDGLSTIERDAYERGFASGQRAGHEFGLMEIDATRRILTALTEELSSLKSELLTTYEHDLITIVFAVAGKVLGEELPRHPETAVAYVREAIAKLGRSGGIVIKVHPGDLERLALESATFVQQAGQEAWLRFEADARLAPGECIAESPQRTIDARIPSQLAAMERELRRTGGRP